METKYDFELNYGSFGRRMYLVLNLVEFWIWLTEAKNQVPADCLNVWVRIILRTAVTSLQKNVVKIKTNNRNHRPLRPIEIMATQRTQSILVRLLSLCEHYSYYLLFYCYHANIDIQTVGWNCLFFRFCRSNSTKLKQIQN